VLTAGFVVLVLALLAGVLKRSNVFSILISAGSVLLAGAALQTLLTGKQTLYMLQLAAPWGRAEIGYTPLSALFSLIIAVGSSVAVWYGRGYLRHYGKTGLGAHLWWLGTLIVSMQVVVVVRHSLLFFLGWEVMTIASLFCILYDHNSEETKQAALYYLAFMQLGAIFVLTGFSLAYRQTGSFNFGDYQQLSPVSVWLLGIGFAFKAGLFPFYSWLPRAHPAAPAHISGLMSGIMLKTGVYGILLILGMTSVTLTAVYVLAGVALITAFLGVSHALVETDIKKILAYSSIENMGIICLGIAFAWIGRLTAHPLMGYLCLAGALLHCLNHSIFKPLLFFLSGNIYQQTHTKELDKLGGLHRYMPQTSVLFLLGAMSISALPLFNGFVSELLLYFGLIEGFHQHNLLLNIASILAASGLALAGTMALFAFVRVYGLSFLGVPRSVLVAQAQEVSAGMTAPLYVLAGMCLISGLLSYPLLVLLNPVLSYLGFEIIITGKLVSGLIQMSAIFLLISALTTLLYIWRRKRIQITTAPTWGCGYVQPSARMQYTANSLINPLAYFLKPFMRRQEDLHKDTAHFPVTLEYRTHLQDFLHEFIFEPVKRNVSRILDIFAGVQNGNTRVYISYGLLFLIALLIWVILGVK
jgi:formate hydrogenlyase subunit 3/multisubunit Na+/H+ antiporter MnhD subunit